MSEETFPDGDWPAIDERLRAREYYYRLRSWPKPYWDVSEPQRAELEDGAAFPQQSERP